MGCWNGSDCITFLPIRYGDPIKLLILKQHLTQPSRGSGVCYTHDLWYPIATAISGKYDGYGCIKNIKENAVSRYLFNILKVGDNIKDAVPDYENNIVGKLNAVERGVVKLANSHYSMYDIDSHLNEWMVHESTWKLLKSFKYTSYENKTVNSYANIIKKCIKVNNIEGKEDWKEDRPLKWEMKTNILNLLDFNSPNCNFLCEAIDWSILNFCSTEMINCIVELKNVTLTMDAMSRYFAPISGAGGQYEDYEKHKLFAEMIIKQCKEKIQENSLNT